MTLAGDMIAASNIVATGVHGLDVVGNTIQRGCESGIDVEGASTGVYLENNVLEDTNANFDYAMGGYPSQCSSDGDAWAPDITVAAGSGGSTTADYNDFDVYGSDATDPYSWGGTSYTSIVGFHSATGQGARDTNDTSSFGGVYLRANESANIEATPTSQSPAVGSANLSAPGELSSDFYGVTPYNTRGAVQFTGSIPDLNIEASAADSSAYGVTATFSLGGLNTGAVSVEAQWGDNEQSSVGVTTATGQLQHSYTDLGTYTVTLIATDNQNDTTSTTISGVQTAGSEYTVYGPARILDTRKGIGTGKVAKIPANGSITLTVGNQGQIPGDGVSAVSLNLTAVDATANGVITAYPVGESLPSVSNLNYPAGGTIANMAIVPLGLNNEIVLHNNGSAPVDLIADAFGYFTPSAPSGSSAYLPFAQPQRVLDTRSGAGPLSAGDAYAWEFVNASYVTAGVFNATVVSPTGNGFLAVYPFEFSDQTAIPATSNVNYRTGQTVPNLVFGTPGDYDSAHQSYDLGLYVGGQGTAQVILDLFGVFEDA